MTTESIPDLPELSENELKVFFIGTYQLGQSVSYVADMLDDDDTPSAKLWYHQGDSNILKFPVPSRHRGNEQYIDYVPESIGCAGIRRNHCTIRDSCWCAYFPRRKIAENLLLLMVSALRCPHNHNRPISVVSQDIASREA